MDAKRRESICICKVCDAGIFCPLHGRNGADQATSADPFKKQEPTLRSDMTVAYIVGENGKRDEPDPI
ncbi:hypothetical protein PG984_009988 [Apiospora sp. TS-2023a]